MIKIIAGKYGSRLIKTLDGDKTRPTSSKTRGAIFSRIGPFFEGGIVLDLFAGSGAFSFECLSRGFDKAYLVDINKEAISVIKENCKVLNENNVEIIKSSYLDALNKLKDIKFDVIFIDPPYKLNVLEDIIMFIDNNEMLSKNGIIIIESLKEYILNDKLGTIYKDKEAFYGISKITYFKKEPRL